MRSFLFFVSFALVAAACGGSDAQPAGDGITLTGDESLVFSTVGNPLLSCPGEAQRSETLQIDLSTGAYSRTRAVTVCDGDPSKTHGETRKASATLTAEQKKRIVDWMATMIHPKVADHCGACDCTLRVRITSPRRDDSYGPDMSNQDCEDKKPVIPFEQLSNLITIADDFVP